MAVAVVLLVAYLGACVALFLGGFDDQWEHRMKAFETMGALAGLAAGWVFGKEVHRMEARRAHDAAVTARAEAAKGHQLAGAIRALSRPSGPERSTPASSSDLQRLAELVDNLFPHSPD